MGRKWKTLCLLFGIAVSILALGFVAYLGLRLLQLNQINRNDCNSVLLSFARSLVYNRADVAKSLTSPDQWARIDTWMAHREAIQCSFSLDPDDNQSWLTCSSSVNAIGTTAVCSCGFTCLYNDRVYRLSISEALLEKSKDGCLVVDWDGVCEFGIEGESERCN
jgi:hypothetical protein